MQGRTKPQVIAHRGYCSLFPQNTMESIEAALYKSDLVEFDILLTKDHQVIIFHDRYLSYITDVAEHKKFADRKKVGSFDVEQNQKERDDWWVHDFTLAELKELKVKQVFSQRPQLKNLHFRIPTLEEALLEVLSIKKSQLQLNECGFLIEIKSLWEHEDDPWDLILIQKLTELLLKVGLGSREQCEQMRFPIALQSFNHRMLLKLSKTQLNLPVIHLFDKIDILTLEYLKERTVRNQIGIGITEEHATAAILQLCGSLQWKVYYWTLRDDQLDHKPFGCGSYQEAYHYLLKIGVFGIITQFPEKGQEYIRSYIGS